MIHAHLSQANTLAPVAGRLAGVPVIGGLHLTTPNPGLRGRARWAVEGLSLRSLATRAIACGSRAAEANRRRLGRLPIDIAPNPGPPLDDLLGMAKPATDPEVPRFIVVGRLAPEKGIDTILEAARRLQATGRKFRVSLVGDGPLEATLRAQAHDMGLSDMVDFLGARADLPDLLRASDIYLSGARSEGLSVALLEAMAHSLPVIATAAGDADLVVDDTVGRLVEPDDPGALFEAMASAARAPDRWRARGVAAQARVARDHCPKEWAARLAEIYHQTADQVRRGRR